MPISAALSRSRMLAAVVARNPSWQYTRLGLDGSITCLFGSRSSSGREIAPGRWPLNHSARLSDVDKLDRRIGLKHLSNVLAPLDRDAGKLQALLAPLIFVRETISEDVPKTHSRQAVVGFPSAVCILRNQNQLLRRIDDDCSPTREVPHQANLDRSSNMNVRKLLRGSRIEQKSTVTPFPRQLSSRYHLKYRRQWDALLSAMAQSTAILDHRSRSKRSTLGRSTSLS